MTGVAGAEDIEEGLAAPLKNVRKCVQNLYLSFLIIPPHVHLLIYLLKTEQYQHLAIQNVR